jgi:Putative prokaryotic signal transducing protein
VDTVIVARVPDIVTAGALCDLLQQAGIKAEMAGGSNMFPGAVIGSYEVVVSAADAARAQALIDETEAEAASGELADDAVAAEADGERDGQASTED